MFWVKDTGAITASKRFESELSSMSPYRYDPAGSMDVLVATHNQMVHVLECRQDGNIRVKWAAGVPCVPVQLHVAKLGGVQGLIVALDDTGRLECYYLGTDPSMYAHLFWCRAPMECTRRTIAVSANRYSCP